MNLGAEFENPIHVVNINLVAAILAIGILDDSTQFFIHDELHYCREINRI